MNITNRNRPYADTVSVPSELSFRDFWDGEAISGLIRSKSADGSPPAFLFLGRRETAMLREHLAEIFGEESAKTIHGRCYKGLVVVTIGCESFLYTAARKTIHTLQDPIARRPAWRDEILDAPWRSQL